MPLTCDFVSALGGTRTPNILIRSQMLYPLSYERSEEHTSELQSRQYIVCRLLLEKKQDTRVLALIVSLNALPLDASLSYPHLFGYLRLLSAPPRATVCPSPLLLLVLLPPIGLRHT